MVLDFLYSLVIVINAIAYLPQIYALWVTKSDSTNISLHTWITWLFTSMVSLCYAYFRIHDTKFILVSLVNLLGVASVIGLTLRNRVRNRITMDDVN